VFSFFKTVERKGERGIERRRMSDFRRVETDKQKATREYYE